MLRVTQLCVRSAIFSGIVRGIIWSPVYVPSVHILWERDLLRRRRNLLWSTWTLFEMIDIYTLIDIIDHLTKLKKEMCNIFYADSLIIKRECQRLSLMSEALDSVWMSALRYLSLSATSWLMIFDIWYLILLAVLVWCSGSCCCLCLVFAVLLV